MRYLIALLFVLVGCGAVPEAAAPPRDALVKELVAKTVALYTLDSEAPRCTGVWVASRRILTASHCASEDERDPIFYSTYPEYIGVFRAPAHLHSMALVKIDKMHDLALYETGIFDTPGHLTATVAASPPVEGADIHFMGHTKGLAWGYKHGWVSAYREANFYPVPEKEGPWMQVSAPIAQGDSGGGAYNDRGELVGVASFMAGKIPNTCFYVWQGTIRTFLK